MTNLCAMAEKTHKVASPSKTSMVISTGFIFFLFGGLLIFSFSIFSRCGGGGVSSVGGSLRGAFLSCALSLGASFTAGMAGGMGKGAVGVGMEEGGAYFN